MLLFWPVVIPFFTAVLTLLAWRSPEIQRGLSLMGAFALLASALAIFSHTLNYGPVAAQAGGWDAPFGITMVADALSATMVLLVGVVATAVILFSFSDVTREEEHFGYHPLTHALLAGLGGAFLTGDIFNMYVWFEVMLIASFGLLVIGGQPNQIAGAIKYVGLNLIATVAFIAGVGLLYGTAGTVNMSDLHNVLNGREGDSVVTASAAFLLFAFASKAALFPLFFWLPASYHTPSFSTSAMFSALVTKVGVYALFRVFSLVYDIEGSILEPILLWGAVLTMAFGVFGALSQSSVRRVLGYTIIGSIGMMILGFAVGSRLAVAAGVFYLFQDVLVKAALFLSAGATARLTGSELFARSGGVWRSRPFFAVVLLIPALSLAGVPPLSGFWPKLMLVQATLEQGSWFLAFATLATGFFMLFAVARVWSAVIWSAHPDGDRAITRTLDGPTWAPLVSLTLLVIFIGLNAGNFVDLTLTIADQIIDPTAYLTAVLGEPK